MYNAHSITIINFAYAITRIKCVISLYHNTFGYTALNLMCVGAPPIWLVLSEPHWITDGKIINQHEYLSHFLIMMLRNAKIMLQSPV